MSADQSPWPVIETAARALEYARTPGPHSAHRAAGTLVLSTGQPFQGLSGETGDYVRLRAEFDGFLVCEVRADRPDFARQLLDRGIDGVAVRASCSFELRQVQSLVEEVGGNRIGVLFDAVYARASSGRAWQIIDFRGREPIHTGYSPEELVAASRDVGAGFSMLCFRNPNGELCPADLHLVAALGANAPQSQVALVERSGPSRLGTLIAGRVIGSPPIQSSTLAERYPV